MNILKILVIGGAGYIGSHVVNDLLEHSYTVTIFDNLSSDFTSDISSKVKFIEGDILNIKDLDNALSSGFDFIIHFAGLKAAGESMIYPDLYATNNINGSINILNSMIKNNCKNIIFSSTAAIYGYPKYIPIDENHDKNPINFYGYTKLAIENILQWYSKLNGIRFAALRYFNAAGYNSDRKIMGIEKNSANLLPIIMEVASGKRQELKVFGGDYDTYDGTCIRDYIHVNDLSSAHIKSIEYIIKNKKNLMGNLATGKGYSILEIINFVEELTKTKINYKIVERRQGDPGVLIADSIHLRKKINWEPKFSSIDIILKSMWEQYNRVSDGVKS